MQEEKGRQESVENGGRTFPARDQNATAKPPRLRALKLRGSFSRSAGKRGMRSREFSAGRKKTDRAAN